MAKWKMKWFDKDDAGQLQTKGYRAECIVKVVTVRADYSSAASKDYCTSVCIPGQQKLGKRYKVTVEELIRKK